MTREEAITLIKSSQLMLINPTTNEPISDLHMALEMAIQALSQVTEVRKLILQAERAGVHLDYGAYKFMNALEKIVGEKQIGEFEQEPCDDAISRADAIEALTGWETEATDEEIEYTLNKLPSVTPSITNNLEKSNFDKRQYRVDTDTAYQCGYEQGKKDSRHKGHWKKIETPQGYCDKYVCSVCGYEIDTSQDEIDEHNYCPNCGAKMESEDKE